MTSNPERMSSGDWYNTDESVLEIQRERQTLMEQYNTTPIADPLGRRGVLIELFGSVGDDVEVRSPVYVDYGSHVRIGTGVFLNYGCQLADVAQISIGDHCQVGPNVQFLTPVHPLDAQRRKDRWETARPITIGANVWIGGGVIICPGVTVGDNSVIGAGSVVTKDIPSGVLAVGSPAKVVRDLS
ncbi:MAG: sugar O-acetyltransferase [Nocardioidaceae bacterium]|nr:sugar O-acetyltransferase [Nocardioidaceae bacterium]